MRPGVLFAVSFCASSLVCLYFISGLGELLRTDVTAYAAVAVCGLLVANDVHRLRLGRYCGLGPRRQTPRQLSFLLGERVGAALWGVDAGTGFSTYRMVNGWWILATMVAVGMAGPLQVALPYGLVFTAAIIGNVLRRERGELSEAVDLLRFWRPVRRVCVVLEVVVLAALIVPTAIA